MKKIARIVSVTAGVVLAGVSGARAQTPGWDVFVDVNVGVQAPSQTLETNGAFSLFGETATIAAAQEIGVAPIVDARVGLRVLPRFALAIAVSGRKDESDGLAVASIPSPISFGSPTITTLSAPGLKRREIGYHFQLVWFLPSWRKIDVSVYAGPSLIHLQQAVVAAGVSGQSLALSSTNETANALGGNGGIDATYPLSDLFGVGAFARYAGATTNLPSAHGVRVGGFQGGGGIRLRF
jgi:hypothetical protein